MFGHSPAPVAKAIRRQARRGLTYMLPTEAAMEAGRLLTKRFGAFRWQIATTATDANRFALRVARAVTGRPKVLVFNGCYHGTVDETMVTIENGRTVTRPGLLGQFADLSASATCVEFNDLAAVEAALKTGEIAAILTEPVMTNSCMVLPQAGLPRRAAPAVAPLRRASDDRRDAYHLVRPWRLYAASTRCRPTCSSSANAWQAGMPTAVWGLTEETARRYEEVNAGRALGPFRHGHHAVGQPDAVRLPGRHAGPGDDRRQLRAICERRAERLAHGLHAALIDRHGAPWHVVRVGARVEFICAPGPLKNGAEAALAHQPQVEAAVHAGLLNRGSLIAPFHNMMLVSPATTKRQIDRLIASFDEILTDLFA